MVGGSVICGRLAEALCTTMEHESHFVYYDVTTMGNNEESCVVSRETHSLAPNGNFRYYKYSYFVLQLHVCRASAARWHV